MRRAGFWGTVLAGTTLLLVGSAAVPTSAEEARREIVAEATARAFTLRADADQGGAKPIPFYFGSYADAYLTTPPDAADGQASWYNLGIAETGIFTPSCTPADQADRIGQAIGDVTTWVEEVAVPQIRDEVTEWISTGTLPDPREGGIVPVAPLPTFPCSERFPGFSQSRHPETEGISSHSAHDLMPEEAAPLTEVTGGVIQAGSFTADATDAPSQTSEAFVAGVRVPAVLQLASARSFARTALEGSDVVSEASWTLTGLCLMPEETGCALRVEKLSAFARVVRNASGAIKERTARVAVAGVHGRGQDQEITAEQLGPGLEPIELGENLVIQLVPSTGDCGDPAAEEVADAGGLKIFGKGGGGPSLPPLPLPAVGTAEGGGLVLGGACATGLTRTLTIEPVPALPGVTNIPGRSFTVAPPPLGPFPTNGGQQFEPGRVVRKDIERVFYRRAPAWRTAPYWVSALAAMALLTALGIAFRRTRFVAPVAVRIDRFSRQFLRG